MISFPNMPGVQSSFRSVYRGTLSRFGLYRIVSFRADDLGSDPHLAAIAEPLYDGQHKPQIAADKLLPRSLVAGLDLEQ